jgi:hypothetical protein
MACAAGCFKVELHSRRSLEGKVQEESECVQFDIVSKCLRSCQSVDTLLHSSLLFKHRQKCSSVCLTSRWCSVPLFNLFVTRPRCSLMNGRVLQVIMLHSLCSTLPNSCFKQLARYMLLGTSHVLVLSSSSLNLQTIKLSTAHIMVDLTYCCTALQKPLMYL